jgi:uncharacterized protein YndB with AHSA1/START domain
MERTTITIQALINAPVEKVWEYYTEPGHITQWNHASEDWHTPWAENDLRPGGKFLSRMESKTDSSGFDFWGIYDEVLTNQAIGYTLGDGRRVRVAFSGTLAGTGMVIDFEAEDTNPIERQLQGWQAILDNFKKYVEEKSDVHR